MIVIKGLLVDLIENGFATSRQGSNVIFPQIPQEIVERFLSAIEVNAPEAFQLSRSMPIVESFDALVYHFSKVGVPNAVIG